MTDERAVLVGLELKGPDGSDERPLLSLEDSLDELAQLSATAGIGVAGQITQKLNRYNPATMIGKGKVQEVKELIQDLGANVVIFDEELSPRHQRELEKEMGEEIKVLDRTTLILDIFAQHAHTREGALQVELAQYEYRLPRLTRQWTHLARQAGGGARPGGGGVGLRGPGETQLESDRREIGRRISKLKEELEQVRAHRGRHRARRRRSGIPLISIVGYTNAGKSTLLNALSDSDVLVEDKLFATLDPTTRRVELPSGQSVLFTDTVGFIQKLPTQLVAAFRATLEEVAEADLLLHVLDLTHPHAQAQAMAVHQTLKDLEIVNIPVVTALNKIDRLAEPEAVNPLIQDLDSIAISALKGWGLDELLTHIEKTLADTLQPVEVLLPYRVGDLIALFHRRGVVEQETHTEQGVWLRGRLPASLVPIILENDQSEEVEE